jgi:hypothetical protein
VDLLVGSLLYESGSDHLRQVFSTQMGLSDQDIVALSGGHTLVGGFFLFFCQLLKAGAYVQLSLSCREDATRTGLDLREPGRLTL